jgi:hypothetical protein
MEAEGKWKVRRVRNDRACVCVCVCVRERERERERERKEANDRE